MGHTASDTERHSYKFNYSEILKAAGNDRICLTLLVGAASFELATPCAQGGLRCASKVPCFQSITFQAHTGSRLQPVEPC